MRLGLFGDGRLGGAVIEAARAAEDVDLRWVAGPGDLRVDPVDVAIDASVAEAVPGHVDWAVTHRVPLVIGATGWSLPDLAERVGNRTGVLVASNFSLTVALLARFATIIGAYADLDPTRDPYIVEHHHRRKADAPSGTAITLANAVLDGSDRYDGWNAGIPAPDEISVASVRAGAEFGHHIVGLDSPAETLEISHRARSRAPFAEGALTAARWLQHRRGVYSMADVASNLLDPLFTPKAAS